MFARALKIFIQAIPVLIMIGVIPVVSNDYALTLLYIAIIAISLSLKREKGDFLFLVFGFCIMLVGEYIFISTGVEVFIRNSLFGIMPLWLPFLWAYAFVAMKRSMKILGV